LLLLLASALTFLASLYLPWQDASHEQQLGQVVPFDAFELDGWTSFGYAAALFALALAAGSGAGLVRARRQPGREQDEIAVTPERRGDSR
jgi:hypothetical protein